MAWEKERVQHRRCARRVHVADLFSLQARRSGVAREPSRLLLCGMRVSDQRRRQCRSEYSGPGAQGVWTWRPGKTAPFGAGRADEASTTRAGRGFVPLPDRESPGFSYGEDVNAIIDAVAESPPPQFTGGGMWEAMRGAMSGFYEARTRGPNRRLYRLFCLLERESPGLDGPSNVVIAGLSQPVCT